MNHIWVTVLLVNYPHIRGSKSKKEAGVRTASKTSGSGPSLGKPNVSLSHSTVTLQCGAFSQEGTWRHRLD